MVVAKDFSTIPCLDTRSLALESSQAFPVVPIQVATPLRSWAKKLRRRIQGVYLFTQFTVASTVEL